MTSFLIFVIPFLLFGAHQEFFLVCALCIQCWCESQPDLWFEFASFTCWIECVHDSVNGSFLNGMPWWTLLFYGNAAYLASCWTFHHVHTLHMRLFSQICSNGLCKRINPELLNPWHFYGQLYCVFALDFKGVWREYSHTCQTDFRQQVELINVQYCTHSELFLLWNGDTDQRLFGIPLWNVVWFQWFPVILYINAFAQYVCTVLTMWYWIQQQSHANTCHYIKREP